MSGGYTTRTGRDILTLPFHLLIDVCHHTILERITGDKDAHAQWVEWLAEPPQRWVFPSLPFDAAAAVVAVIDRMRHGGVAVVDPAGWDDAALLRSMQRGAA